MFIKYYSDAGCGEGSGDGSSNTRSPAPLVPAPASAASASAAAVAVVAAATACAFIPKGVVESVQGEGGGALASEEAMSGRRLPKRFSMSSGAGRGDERACAGDPVLFVALFSSADVVPSTMSHRTPLTVKNKQAPAAQHFTGVLYSAPSLRLCTPENARSEALSSALVLLGTDSRGSKSSGSELISMACMLLARTVPIVRPRSARRAASDGVRAARRVSYLY
jgi:hypothetical protein